MEVERHSSERKCGFMKRHFAPLFVDCRPSEVNSHDAQNNEMTLGGPLVLSVPICCAVAMPHVAMIKTLNPRLSYQGVYSATSWLPSNHA